jgi:hypothetical protein
MDSSFIILSGGITITAKASMILESVITCPSCGYQATEQMPIDACRVFYDCRGCGEQITMLTSVQRRGLDLDRWGSQSSGIVKLRPILTTLMFVVTLNGTVAANRPQPAQASVSPPEPNL